MQSCTEILQEGHSHLLSNLPSKGVRLPFHSCICLLLPPTIASKHDRRASACHRSAVIARACLNDQAMLKSIRKSPPLELTWLVPSVAPNASFHVARASREEVASRTWRNRDDAVLVSLQHHMGVSSLRIPELHATVFRTRHDPVTVGCQTDA
jgi:hypothetical protein